MLAVRIGDKLAPVMLKLLDKLTPLVDMVINASDETLEFYMQMGAVVAAGGPLLMVFGKIISAGASITGVLGPAIRTLITATGMLRGPLKASIGLIGKLGTTAGGSASKMGKLGGALKGAAGVAAAGAAGYAAGELLNKAIFDEQNKAYADLVRNAEGFSSAGKKSTEQVASSLKKIQLMRVKLATDFINTESIFGSVAALVTDVESPAERMKRAMKNLDIEQKKMIDNYVAAKRAAGGGRLPTDARAAGVDAGLVGRMQGQKEAEATLNINFEGVPEGVKPVIDQRNKRGNIKVLKRGAVMEGAL